MAYHGYKVPAAEVSKNDLAKINQKLSTWGQVPATVIAGWDSSNEVGKQLNTWQGELLAQGDPSQLKWDEPTIGTNTNRALSEYTIFKNSSSKK